MNKRIAASLFTLVLLVGGCSENTKEADVTTEKPIETTEVEESDNAQVEYTDWEGNYVFIDDEIEGTLTIFDQQEAEFTVLLSAEKKDWENTLLAEEKFEGKGTAENDLAAITVTDKDCAGELSLNGSEVTVELNGTECDKNLNLSGVYKKIAAEKPELFSINDGKIYINGLTFADTPATTKAFWGNPDPDNSTADDVHLLDETVHTYAEDGMQITYYQHKLYAMTVEADKEDLAKITKAFPGEHYKDSNSDTELFHMEDNDHLLIYRSEESGAEQSEFLLIPVDGNFKHAVDSGIYVPVRE
ncbi:hypothetical protein QWT69_03795 [Sporosarcina oncorhynchi]|uniref:Uncharacterized protein n=1 Tax=Sporosarcina oncorhynchi TaxID=3056444 RepID=A0ABZ0L8H7_9BACL|nr:hypothetical protein [Sporosarcina sp. T2O-4]WOV88258.1 hypothetical protein QWT69_03795 [Sporosarcina sp. T2O-4]